MIQGCDGGVFHRFHWFVHDLHGFLQFFHGFLQFFQEIWENCVLYNDYDSDLKRENCVLMMVLLQKNVFY
jgi:hypothetical protein